MIAEPLGELRGSGAANASGAHQHDFLVFRHFLVAGLEFGERDQFGSGDPNGIELVLFADINEHRAILEALLGGLGINSVKHKGILQAGGGIVCSAVNLVG